MNNNWYMTKMLADARTHDLLDEADHYRSARQVQTHQARSWRFLGRRRSVALHTRVVTGPTCQA